MATIHDSNCWVVFSVDHIQWILDAPRLAMLLINTCLLIDIVRVLLTNFSKRESGSQLSTAKATLFLMPIFGVQFLLTVYRPTLDSCGWEQAYFFFTYSIEALQGLMVAVFYCYANKEVHGLIKMTYKKSENVITNRFRRRSNFRRVTSPSTSARKTFSTILENNLTSLPEVQEPAEPKNVQVTDLDDYYIDNNNIIEEPQRRSSKEDAITIGIANRSFTLDPEDDGISNLYNEVNMDTDSVNSQNLRKQPVYCGVNKQAANDASTVNETASAASDTVEYYEWLKCASPTSSLYDNSLDEYEIRYLDQKIKPDKQNNVNKLKNATTTDSPPPAPMRNLKMPQKDDEESASFSDFRIPENIVESLDGKEIFDEVKRRSDCSQQLATTLPDDVTIDADAMFPNRNSNDKIVFINP